MADTDNKLDPFTVITGVQWNTSGPHFWTASAVVSVRVGTDAIGDPGWTNGGTLVVQAQGIGTATIVGDVFSDPSGIFDQDPRLPGGGFIQVNVVRLSANPSAIAALTVVAIISSPTLDMSVQVSVGNLDANAHTSGRPGGDLSQSALSTVTYRADVPLRPGSAGSIVTVTGRATAALNGVTATVSGNVV